MKAKPSSKATAQILTLPNPITTNNLVGREREYTFIKDGIINKKLHHSVCLVGQKGVGKMTTIANAIKDVFSFFEKKNPVNFNSKKMIEEGVHPDVLIVSGNPESAKNEISVDQIRQMIDFAMLTPSCFDFKIIVIDSLDNLNNSSANAILKILEEPPKNTYFLTTYHTKGKILKTIKSRCTTLFCKPLTQEQFSKVLTQSEKNIDPSTFTKLYEISSANASMAIIIKEIDAVNGYSMFIQDVATSSSTSISFFKQVADFGINPLDILEMFVSRILIKLAYLACGLNKTIQEEEQLISFSKHNSINPLEIIEKTKMIKEAYNMSKVYNIAFNHLILVILGIIRSEKTAFQTIQKYS